MILKNCKNILLLTFICGLLLSCLSNTDDNRTSQTDSINDVIVTIADTNLVVSDSVIDVLTTQQIDSINFRINHHYCENFNFVVIADSLILVPHEGDLIRDTCVVYKNDIVVVADIQEVSNSDSTVVNLSSYNIKVAKNQFNMGWLSEKELLNGGVPDDDISMMLYHLSNSRGIWMSALVAICLLLLLFGRNNNMDGHCNARRDLFLNFFNRLNINRFGLTYPKFFIASVAILATIYASVQNLIPQYWQEYYFHPTLNPFQLPFVMALLVTNLWMVIILFIAVIDEVYHSSNFLNGLSFVFELLGIAIIVYILMSWSTLFYFGYLLLPLFLFSLFRKR